MKKKALSFLIIGVVFLTPAPWARCDQKGEYQPVIDSQSVPVSLARTDGTPAEFIGWTAVGPVLNGTPIPPPIVNYLLPGKGSISGLVWNDLNGNDQPDTGESGVPNTRVYLDYDNSSTHSSGDPFQLTDADGLYTFPRVKPGTKNIFIDNASLPAGFEPTTSYPVTVELSPYQKVDDANFGVQDLSGEITGTVWDQTDNVPISGVTVFLEVDNVAATGDPRSVSTDAAGTFRFSKVRGDDYLVYVEISPLGNTYIQTPVAGEEPALVTLPPGGSQTVDFAYAHQSTISGVVRDDDGNPMAYVTLFIDLNGNGLYDAGEPLVMSDQYGNYIFDQLLAGTYTVLILTDRLPPGYETLSSPGTVTVATGESFATADGITSALPVTISGLVWDDVNGNRVREPSENGLEGAPVYLDSNNNGILDGGEPTTVTNGEGTFTFTGLKHGSYFIRPDETSLLAPYNQTTLPNPVYWTLAPGQSYDGARFGYQGKLVPLHTLHDPNRLAWGGDGNLYVADMTTDSVYILDGDLNVLGELKGLAQPRAAVADSSGNIYVGNQGRNNVEVYSATGSLLHTIGGGSISDPSDLALDRENNLYVLDGANSTVLVFDQAGILKSAIGDPLLIKRGVAIALGYRDDGAGNEIGELYVADQKSCVIHVFDLDGTYKIPLGGCGTMYTTNWDGLFSGLMGVDLDSYGNIHGVDNSLNVVQVFSPQTGAFLRSYNAYPAENEYRLNLQTDIAIHPLDQRVLVSNVATRSVETIATVPAP